MSELDALFNGKKTVLRGSCVVCGAPRTVQVTVRIARLNDKGTVAAGKSVTNSAIFCDDHGYQAFTTGRDAIGRAPA